MSDKHFNPTIYTDNPPETLKERYEKLRQGAKLGVYSIGGQNFERIPYGSEKSDWWAEQIPCHDCGAVKDKLHIPGCDVEECPSCGRQAIGCACQYAD